MLYHLLDPQKYLIVVVLGLISDPRAFPKFLVTLTMMTLRKTGKDPPKNIKILY